MNKISASLIGACLLAVTGCSGCLEHFAPVAQDSVADFGRFQIGKTPSGEGLEDVETHHTLCFPIKDWYRKGDWVYAVSDKGKYVVLNHRTAFVGEFDSIEEVPPEYQEALPKLKAKE